MTRPASEILEDLLAVALRIERILTREADNAAVDYYVRRLSQPRPVTLSGAPEPPLPKVQTTWREHTAYVGKATVDAPQPQWTTPPASYSHGGWIHRDAFSMVGP